MPSLCKHHFKWRRGAVVFLVDPIPGLEKQLCHVWWYWSPLFWLTMLTNVNWLHLRGNVSTLKMLADSSSKLTSKRSLKWLKNNGSSRNLHVNAGVKQRGSLRGVDAAPVLALCWCTIAATSVHKSQHVQLRVMLETEIIRHRENQSKTQPWVKPRWAPHTWKENKAKIQSNDQTLSRATQKPYGGQRAPDLVGGTGFAEVNPLVLPGGTHLLVLGNHHAGQVSISKVPQVAAHPRQVTSPANL